MLTAQPELMRLPGCACGTASMATCCVPCGILPEHAGLCLWWIGHPSMATETPLLIDILLVLQLLGRLAIGCISWTGLLFVADMCTYK